MNKLHITCLLLFSFFFQNCKKIRDKNVTVIKDCTGTYLRFKEKDYLVCNLEKISTFQNSTKLSATFRKVEKCINPSFNETAVCMMYHKNEGLIEIIEIDTE